MGLLGVRHGVAVLQLEAESLPAMSGALKLAKRAAMKQHAFCLVVSFRRRAVPSERWLRRGGMLLTRPPRFEPRLIDAQTGEIIPLPTLKPLPFELEVLPSEDVRVQGRNLFVSGAELRHHEWTFLSDNDTVTVGGTSFTYLSEPLGREQLADWFVGWQNPNMVRAHLRLRN